MVRWWSSILFPCVRDDSVAFVNGAPSAAPMTRLELYRLHRAWTRRIMRPTGGAIDFFLMAIQRATARSGEVQEMLVGHRRSLDEANVHIHNVCQRAEELHERVFLLFMLRRFREAHNMTVEVFVSHSLITTVSAWAAPFCGSFQADPRRYVHHRRHTGDGITARQRVRGAHCAEVHAHHDAVAVGRILDLRDQKHEMSMLHGQMNCVSLVCPVKPTDHESVVCAVVTKIPNWFITGSVSPSSS